MKRYQATIIISLLIVLVVAVGVVIYLVQKDDTSHDMSSPTPQTTTQDESDKKDPANNSKNTSEDVTKEQAEKIVLDKYGGEIKETESDHYNGKEAWEVEVRDSKEGRIEVKVDKSTGEILDVEKD